LGIFDFLKSKDEKEFQKIKEASEKEAINDFAEFLINRFDVEPEKAFKIAREFIKKNKLVEIVGH
jgi:hypothetical protein